MTAARPLPTVLVTDGTAIAWTNYWASERAFAGYPCLAYVEGKLQILVPPWGERLFDDLPPVGTPAEFWEDCIDGLPVYRLLWFEAPRMPHELRVDEDHWFGYYPRVHVGRTVPLIWYTQVDESGVMERRRELIQLGRAS